MRKAFVKIGRALEKWIQSVSSGYVLIQTQFLLSTKGDEIKSISFVELLGFRVQFGKNKFFWCACCTGYHSALTDR